ncbi:MAG: radical SAM protein [Candidatus Thorarchaeota archaeon]
MEQESIIKQIKSKRRLQLAKLAQTAKAAKDSNYKPFIFHFLTTLKCNCSCETCLWKDNTKRGELTLEEIKKVYSEAMEAGFLVTILWGGEPLIRNDISEIIQFAKNKCKFIIVGIVTNGWFLPEKINKIGNNLDFILISLDSPRPKEHDQIRGLKGLYDKIMESIKIIKMKYPLISLQFSFSISKYNINRVEEMIDLSNKIDVPVAFNVINTSRHFSTGSIDEKGSLSANEDELSIIFQKILEAKRNGAKIVNSELYLKHFIGGKKLYHCHTKKVFLFVNSNGDIENCLELDKPIANLKETPISKALQLPIFKDFVKKCEECNSCNSPTMIDTSYIWNDVSLLTKSGGISFG